MLYNQLKMLVSDPTEIGRWMPCRIYIYGMKNATPPKDFTEIEMLYRFKLPLSKTRTSEAMKMNG